MLYYILRALANLLMNDDTQKTPAWLDGAAVALSTLCLLHCLLLPLVVVGVPMLAQFAESHLHYQLLIVVIPLSFVALGIGYRRHRIWQVPAGGALGVLLLVIGATVAHTHYGLLADRLFTIAGSLTLATAHFFNSYRKKLSSSSL